MGKTLVTLALLGTLALGGSGCKNCGEKAWSSYAEEESGVIYEDAIVSETVYSPSRHGSDLAPTIDITGEGGLGVAIVDVQIPEKYAIVFKCQHGKFIVEGTDRKHKELWGRFNRGDSVTVSYKEMYKSTYKDTDCDGKKELIHKSLIGYDFLEAQLKNKN